MLRWLIPVILLLGSCNGSEVSYRSLKMDGDIADDSLAEHRIAPYRDSLTARMDRVIVNAQTAIVRGKPDSPLGSLIADIILEEAKRETPEGQPKPDFCLLNIGGLRIDLPEGDVRTGHIFELMPFENGISLVKVTPKGIQDLLTYIIEVGGQPVSGLRMEVKDGAATSVTVNGRPLEARSYVVATSDYLADGGDRMYFFNDHEWRTDIDLKIRDAILRHLTEMGNGQIPVVQPLNPRIIIAP